MFICDGSVRRTLPHSSLCLPAVVILLASFLVLTGFVYDANAVTVITVEDETSCEALSLSGGTATWEGSTNTCIIPEGATLQIDDEEVLDLYISLELDTDPLDGTATITNMQGGTINVNAGTFRPERYSGADTLNNYGIINIRTGAGASFEGLVNHPTGIINNHGGFGTGSGLSIANDGTINNYADGTINLHGEFSFFNSAQSVINNHGLMVRNDPVGEAAPWSFSGVVNNYGSLVGGLVVDGSFYNFGRVTIQDDENKEAILVIDQGSVFFNHGDLRNNGGDTTNRGTINNYASGSIANSADFTNYGRISNQGVFSNHCLFPSTLTNNGIFTGNPVKNYCETIPPDITAPADVTLTTSSSRINLCQNIPITSISAIGDDGAGHVAANTVDNNVGTRWSHAGAASWIRPDLGSTKVICSVDVAWHAGNQRVYNFVISVSNDGINFNKVFTGHSSGTTLSTERYEFPDTVGRYVKITVNANNVNTFASVTEIDVNGYTTLGLPVFSDNTDPFPLVGNNVPANGLPVGSRTIIWRATDASGYYSDLNGNTASDAQLVKVVAGDTTLPTISISSPATGSTITGPSSGVKINLKGAATDAGSGILKVELKSLKSGIAVHGYQQATPGAPNNWGTWSHTLTFTQTGTYTITARATDKAGNQNWYSITVKIAFQSDTTLPTVSITSPQNGASFSGPSSVPKKINFAGTAADSGGGVQKVELKSLKGGIVVHAYQSASTSNNWANWARTLSFTESGAYTITARVTDIAGNQNWHSITVNITLR